VGRLVTPMRIEDAIYSGPRQSVERSRSPGVEFALQEEAALTRTAVEDIVQLTLSRDGIWEVSAPQTVPDGNIAASADAVTPTPPVWPDYTASSHGSTPPPAGSRLWSNRVDSWLTCTSKSVY
jgi:hypothetical protein